MDPEPTRKLFDRWASTYDRGVQQTLMFGPVHEAVLDAFEALGAAPGAVLDVGCGTGRMLESAARRWRGARLTGVDVSAAMVAAARRKHEGDARFTFEEGDASELRLTPASFDATFSTMSFHHWGDQPAGLRGISRGLRSGGLFVLADVDLPFVALLSPLFERAAGAHFRGPSAIERLLEQAGFAVVSRRRFRAVSPVQLFVARKS
jgi:ubiquinone/menaquinone biosynthesis C-methylase UbiE